MSDKPLNGARLHFCREYTTNGHNGAEAYRTAYPGCESGHRQSAGTLLTNTDIIKEIGRIEAETAEKLNLSREGQHKKLEIAIKMAKDAKNPAAYISGVREQNEMLGYHRDKAPNQEKMDEIRRRMSEEEVLLAQERAQQRTTALSVSKPHLSKEIA